MTWKAEASTSFPTRGSQLETDPMRRDSMLSRVQLLDYCRELDIIMRMSL